MGGRSHLKVKSDGGWHTVGGYMNAKIQKLDEQFKDKSNNLAKLSTLFDGIAIYVNGHTEPTNDELKMLMAQHGGKFHNYYLSHSTTHVIASNLCRATAKGLRPNQNVIRPEWIVDSIREEKVLPIQPYIVAAYGASRKQTILAGFSGHSASSNAKECSAITESCQNSGTSSNKLSLKNVSSTTDSSFLSDFYSHSRLHFLSTWKSELADYVRSLATTEVELSGFKQLVEIAASNPVSDVFKSYGKCIMHVDMDCFFVSVGLLSRPHLRGHPVAVTHHLASTPSTNHRKPGVDEEFERNFYKSKMKIKEGDSEKSFKGSNEQESGSTSACSLPSYSEIASCNYEARQSGLKNGMFYGKAKELCPNLIAIPYDFLAYRQASIKLYSVLSSYTRDLEAVSCDEALLDMTNVVLKTGLSPLTITKHIRETIEEETGCSASAGVGPNILLARMATKLGKPNGQYEVTTDQTQTFIYQQSVRDLPGVGHATTSRLQDLGVSTCGELQKLSLDMLKKEFGTKTGQKLHDSSRGIDNRKVSQSKERKSVSADVNYGIRLSSDDELFTFLGSLAKEVSDRLKRASVIGKKLTLKLMLRREDAPLETAKFGGHGVCRSLSRSRTLELFTDNCDVIKKETIVLIKSMQINVSDLRGIGIQMTQLSSEKSVMKGRENSIISRFMISKKQSMPCTTEGLFSGSECIDDMDDIPCAQPTLSRSQCFHSDDVENIDNPVHPVSLKSSSSTSRAEVIDLEKPPSGDPVSMSFLEALPDDIRREVESDLTAHQKALQNEKIIWNSGTVQFPLFNVNPPKNLNQNKHNATKITKCKKSPSKRNRNAARLKLTRGSPTKLITDIFRPARKDVDAVIMVKKGVVDANDQINEEFSENDFATSHEHSLPSLGGATTISESRDIIRKWTFSHANSAPLQSDINDVKNFLGNLIVRSRDLEGAHLLLRTLRRSVMLFVERCDVIGTQACSVTSWIEAYNSIATTLRDTVEANYNGAELNVKFIT